MEKRTRVYVWRDRETRDSWHQFETDDDRHGPYWTVGTARGAARRRLFASRSAPEFVDGPPPRDEAARAIEATMRKRLGIEK